MPTFPILTKNRKKFCRDTSIKVISPRVLPFYRALWWWPSRSLQTPAHRRWKTTWACWWPGHWTECPASSPGPRSHWCCHRCRNWWHTTDETAVKLKDSMDRILLMLKPVNCENVSQCRTLHLWPAEFGLLMHQQHRESFPWSKLEESTS